MAKSVKQQKRTVQNAYVMGIAGKKRAAQVYVIDESNPAVFAKSSGNIYIDATLRLQLKSKTAICQVSEKRVENYGTLVHHVGGNETVRIEGVNQITVDKEQKIHVKKDQTVHLAKKQTMTVDEGQTIAITKGGRIIDVLGGGELKETITGDRTVTVSGKNKVDVKSECKWIKHGHSYGFSFSADELLKFSNSLAISIGAKEEGNLAIVETLNASGGFEQNFGLKRVFNAAIVKETCVGIKMGDDKSVSYQKNGAMEKSKKRAVDSAATFVKAESKLWKMGAKMWLFD